MKKVFNFMNASFAFVLTFIASILGGGVSMAVTGTLDDGGTTTPGYGKEQNDDLAPTDSNQNGDGIATTTSHLPDSEDFLDKEIDRKITKIRPMSTPIDQISRYAEAGSTKQFAFKYFSIGTRPVKTTLSAAVTATASGSTTTVVKVADPSMFSLDDTLRVVGEKAKYNYKGNAYNATAKNTPDLLLKVAHINANGDLDCYAVNGNLDAANQPSLVPAITTGKTVIRLGKACAELDVQTGRFANIPTAVEQYCQNFMMQVEQSTFDKISAKNVDWNFSDLEEDGVYDMRLGMEGSFLFGDMGAIKHVSKDNMYTWFTKGIWWQAGKDITVGTYANSKVTVTDDDLVDIAKDLFVGTGSGSKQKIMFCGSDMLAALSKIDSDKFRLKENVEAWNLKFKSWDTDFGEILTIHHELFDLNGMSDCALALDPEYLGKKKFISWTRTVLDLKTAGVRNTDAVVLQEASALYLRYPKAHARMKLAGA